MKKYQKPTLLVCMLDARPLLNSMSIKDYQTGGRQTAGGDED